MNAADTFFLNQYINMCTLNSTEYIGVNRFVVSCQSMLVVEINEFVFGTIYVHAVVKGGGYCSRCSRQLEWKQAPLTTCDDSDDVHNYGPCYQHFSFLQM